MSEPDAMKKVYNVPTWTEDTIKLVKKYTDRKIILHNKFSKEPLKILLKDAWAFISLQSTAGFMAMLNGVPSYFTDASLKNISKIEDIEHPKIDYNIFNSLAYGQWTLKEMETGEAWETISKNKV